MRVNFTLKKKADAVIIKKKPELRSSGLVGCDSYSSAASAAAFFFFFLLPALRSAFGIGSSFF